MTNKPCLANEKKLQYHETPDDRKMLETRNDCSCLKVAIFADGYTPSNIRLST
ncbi:hypothetical protein [Providencia hangzhouensis]|uniref:hypothetical protein n=1 Tax=Providencia hangzhouensis TaxID=3031799 RepID=UPI0034DD8208